VQKARTCWAFLVGQDRGVGEPRMVIDDGMDEVEPNSGSLVGVVVSGGGSAARLHPPPWGMRPIFLTLMWIRSPADPARIARRLFWRLGSPRRSAGRSHANTASGCGAGSRRPCGPARRVHRRSTAGRVELTCAAQQQRSRRWAVCAAGSGAGARTDRPDPRLPLRETDAPTDTRIVARRRVRRRHEQPCDRGAGSDPQ
jgi:hypothetical protein